MQSNAILQQKTSLESFYKGWHHFASMDKGENFLVFKLQNARQAADSAAKAISRIAALNLPLTVLMTGERSNTFIVKEVA